MALKLSEDGIPKYEELMNALLVVLHKLGGSAAVRELKDATADHLIHKGMHSAVISIPHGQNTGKSKLRYRLSWALTNLKNMGLIDNLQRGVWSLTAEGRKPINVEPHSYPVLKQLRKEQRQARADRAKAVAANKPPSWRKELLDVLRNVPPDAFERLCQRLLRESGFIEVKVTGRAGDGGIDGHGIIRIGGLISFPVLFQCKRYSGSVGAGVIRDFRGAMAGRAEKGLIITTGHFTAEAQREATRDGAVLIDLINGELVTEKMKELELGVGKRMVEEVTVDRGWFERI